MDSRFSRVNNQLSLMNNLLQQIILWGCHVLVQLVYFTGKTFTVSRK